LKVGSHNAAGWDPYYQPTAELVESDIVNLGYVLNVIEDRDERLDALLKAFALTRVCLVVSVLTPGLVDTSTFREFQDGGVSSRNTFQKVFEQEEARLWIHQVLDEEPIAVAPGIFFVFRDEVEEQRFLANRHRRRQDINHLLALLPPSNNSTSWNRWVIFENHKELLTALWQRTIELGRLPAPEEIDEELRRGLLGEFGSIRRGAQAAQVGFEPNELQVARQQRIEDLELYFALDLFNRRKPYTKLPPELQLDLQAFFGSYARAREEGKKLLFSLADTEVILEAALQAHRSGVGYLDEEHSLQLHAGLIERLPAALRAYLGCAEKMFGDLDQADLVKIHITSGKLTLLMYDDFDKNPLPTMRERVKINLREQDIEFFDYSEYAQRPILYIKSRYLAPDHKGYKRQLRFDRQLENTNLFDLREFGPSPTSFTEGLANAGLVVDGWGLTKI